MSDQPFPAADRLRYLENCPRLRAEFCEQCRGILADSEYGQSLIERKLQGHLCKCPHKDDLQTAKEG